MAPTLTLAAVSLAESALLGRYASPAYSLHDSAVTRALILFAVQTLAWFTWSVAIYPHYVSPLRKLPQPEGGSFLMGHFTRIRKEPTGWPHKEWVRNVPNDGVFHYRFALNAPRVSVTTPKGLAEVLVHKSYDFVKPPNVRHGLGRILGIGVLLAEGDEHKRQRRLLMPAFSFRHVKDLYRVFWSKASECTQAMTAALESQGDDNVLNLQSWASRTTLDIIGAAGMGQDFHAIENPDSELNATYKKIFSPSKVAATLGLLGNFVPLALLRLLPIKRNFEIEGAAQTIKRICLDLIRQKKQKMEKGERVDVDIISVALESGGFSDDDLVNQMMTFLAAGHETTATSLTWAGFLLCQKPEVQKRLREEVRAHLPSPRDSNSTITSKDIDQMPYLNAVCNEILRLKPPVPATLRVTDHDTTILGHHIPKGTTVIVPILAINTNPKFWGEDADEFNPDRWLAPGCANTGGAESNYALETFIHGPRSCIGSSFAKAELACILAAWAGTFEMEFADPATPDKVEIQSGVTARPKGGMSVKLKAVGGW
ncbi:cytochrome P450 78A3 [Phyllosticta citrichinensis]